MLKILLSFRCITQEGRNTAQSLECDKYFRNAIFDINYPKQMLQTRIVNILNEYATL